MKKAAEITRAFCAPVYSKTLVGRAGTMVGCEDDYPHRQEKAPPDEVVPNSLPSNSASALNVTNAPKAVDQVPWWLEAFHEGSFSRPGADEVVAEFVGLSMDAYLLEREAGRFKVKAFGERIGDCKVTRTPSQRDVLICQYAHMNGTTLGRWVDIVDWQQNPPTTTSLFGFDHAQSTRVSLCDGFPFFSGYLGETELIDLDHDGLRDLRFSVRYFHFSRERITQYQARETFKPACACVMERYGWGPSARLKPGCPCPSLVLPKETRASLIFLARESGFVPTPQTRAVLAEISSN